jgi:hypothetical protein
MIIALDDESLFHPMVWACKDITLQAFPCLSDGLVHELLKAWDLIPESISFTQQKELGEECIGTFLPG